MPLDHQLTDGTVTRPGFDQLIVFTDLDGTLLDHETYSHAEAEPALDRLRALGIPLILASSKTAAELVPLRQELGFAHCEAIIENGSGILEPDGANQPAEDRYGAIRQALGELPAGLRRQFQGFGDCSAAEVAARTGLTVAQAAKAKERRFSEPGLWLGSEAGRREFVTAINARGLSALQGGRFMTLSFGGNKAERMLEIVRRRSAASRKPFSVALGDADNDLAMIRRADLGVIIPNPAHAGIPRLDEEADGRVIRAAAPGPKGWNGIIVALLNDAGKT